DLLHHRAAAFVHDQRVDAVAPLANLIGQAPLAPALDLDHRAAQFLDPLGDPIEFLVHPVLVETRFEDERRFVLAHGSGTSLPTRRLNRFMAAMTPSPTQHSTASAASCSAASADSVSSGPYRSSTCS